MTSVDTSRFLRPTDMGNMRRNNRRIQAGRILRLVANTLLACSVVLGGAWLVQQMHRDTRFSVRSIEITGSVNSDVSDLKRISGQWNGANLFELEIESLRAELTGLPWVESVAVEKRIPDTLVIRVSERSPVALQDTEDGLWYVDRDGRAFAKVSQQAGNPDLPFVSGASADDRRRAVEFLERLRTSEPDLYSRISEVDPLSPSGFRVYDRELRTKLFLPESGAPDRWRRVHALARIESWGEPGAVEYADLRFERRIVVLPRVPQQSMATGAATTSSAAILAN